MMATKQLVDSIIFSYHRPLQLYALLESMDKHIQHGRGATYVLYRADTVDYTAAYKQVQNDFSDVVFVQQGPCPRQDFKPLLMTIFERCLSDYIMFAVDDMMVIDTLDLSQVIHALKNTNAYGFYLRLGSNICHCYTTPSPTCYVPRLHNVCDTVLAWDMTNAHADWGYSCTVDMTVYKKSTVEPWLQSLSYSGPNVLEAVWSARAQGQSGIGVCYATSKVINIPCNRVQQVFPNLHMHEETVDDLLALFMAGKKIAIDDLYRLKHTAPHVEYTFRYIDRDSMA